MEMQPTFRQLLISIHALREEGDLQCLVTWSSHRYFNPRPPRGGRLLLVFIVNAPDVISIHALREEGDITASFSRISKIYFNPRPPRGGRQQKQRKNPPLLFHYTRLCTI